MKTKGNNSGCGRQQQSGSVLIITLFIIFFLSVIALQVSHTMRLRMQVLQRFMQRQQARYCAQQAVLLAEASLAEDRDAHGFDSLHDSWRETFQQLNRPRTFDVVDANGAAAGWYQVNIIDEKSKINLITAGADTIEHAVAGTRANNSSKLAAAVSAYKKKFSPAQVIASVYELRNLEEMSGEVFLGEDTNDNGMLDSWEDDRDQTPPPDNGNGIIDGGIKDLFTVYGDGTININTASQTVLGSMPGMTIEIAQLLVEAREEHVFESLEEIKTLLFISEPTYRVLAQWAGVSSDIYRVNVVAGTYKSALTQQVTAVIDRSQNPAKICYWRED
jgi:Tfp pilus assembly protein PilX